MLGSYHLTSGSGVTACDVVVILRPNRDYGSRLFPAATRAVAEHAAVPVL